MGGGGGVDAEWVDTMDERAVYVYFRGCE
jgi:hypothetical protein